MVYPALAYPTYDIGARLRGASSVAADALSDAPESSRLRWMNSPSNPTGRVLPASALREAVGWARAHDCVLASDECYIELGWTAEPVSVLHPSVSGGSPDGVLAVFSLSKRSDLAGYRAGFVTGDPALMKQLLLVCPAGRADHARPGAGGDDRRAGRRRPRRRAEGPVRGAACGAGGRADRGRVPHRPLAGRALPVGDQAGARLLGGLRTARGRVRHPRRARVHVRADGNAHIRVALTATDERVATAGERLRRMPAR